MIHTPTFILLSVFATTVSLRELYEVWLVRPDIVLSSLAGVATAFVLGPIWLWLKVRRG